MAYLTERDYTKQIQADNLNQIISSDSTIRTSVELRAQAEMISYLAQKYHTSEEFQDTTAFSLAVAYNAGDLVYLDGSEWDSSTTYAVNDIIARASIVYYAKTSNSDKLPDSNADDWGILGDQYTLYNATLPNSEFNYSNTYATGDIVFWKNKVYTCIKPSTVLSTSGQFQYVTYNNIPLPNVAPDDPVYGLSVWGTGVAYTIAAGTLITNIKWTLGDNRSQQLVGYLIDMVLFHLHSRISPRAKPKHREDAYYSAIEWLNQAAKGEVTADIPKIQPKQGGRIRYGGNIKQQNSY